VDVKQARHDTPGLSSVKVLYAFKLVTFPVCEVWDLIYTSFNTFT